MKLEREYILKELSRIFNEKFEIKNPGVDDDLREEYEFDSIDAIELLVEIEKILGFPLSQEQKKWPWRSVQSIRFATIFRKWNMLGFKVS